MKKLFNFNKKEKNPGIVKGNLKSEFPFKFQKGPKYPIKFIDELNDKDLNELNNILDWNCFVLDKQGRRFGNVAWTGKRVNPEIIPDPRHLILKEKISFKDKHVLEIGCFEGIHTISLCELGAKVTAIDSRIENIVKTIVRCSLFGHHPIVFKSDVEKWNDQFELLKANICHHIGVLYHLKDPVRHLIELGKLIDEAIILDTHIARDNETQEIYEVNGKKYPYKAYKEGSDVFSGMYDHAKWLKLDTLREILTDCGFTSIELIETREERNGPRILLLAKK